MKYATRSGYPLGVLQFVGKSHWVGTDLQPDHAVQEREIHSSFDKLFLVLGASRVVSSVVKDGLEVNMKKTQHLMIGEEGPAVDLEPEEERIISRKYYLYLEANREHSDEIVKDRMTRNSLL